MFLFEDHTCENCLYPELSGHECNFSLHNAACMTYFINKKYCLKGRKCETCYSKEVCKLFNNTQQERVDKNEA
jgi:hypothetical protein